MPTRVLVCATAIVLCASPALGQVDADYRVGVKFGAARAEFSGADVPDAGTSTKTGLSLGVYLDHELADVVGVQPELTYVQRGVGVEDGDVSGNYNIGYLDLPLLGKFGLPLWGGLKPHVLAGPALSFRLTCRVEIFMEEGSRQVPCDHPDVDLPIRTVDYAFIAGGGLDLDVAEGSATVQLRRYVGMRPIYDTDVSVDLKNRSWSLLVGWSMPYGG